MFNSKLNWNCLTILIIITLYYKNNKCHETILIKMFIYTFIIIII